VEFYCVSSAPDGSSRDPSRSGNPDHVRVPFKDGEPEGSYENFATGFWASGERRAEVWGRPAALAIGQDGALLVADDTGGTIWRIAYTGSSERANTPSPRTTGSAGQNR
jgi:glucose/arabinose dehydrogenase